MQMALASVLKRHYAFAACLPSRGELVPNPTDNRSFDWIVSSDLLISIMCCAVIGWRHMATDVGTRLAMHTCCQQNCLGCQSDQTSARSD